MAAINKLRPGYMLAIKALMSASGSLNGKYLRDTDMWRTTIGLTSYYAYQQLREVPANERQQIAVSCPMHTF